MSSAQGIRIEDQSKEEYEARKTFQETDPPDHTKVRHILNIPFSEKNIAKYETQVRNVAKETLLHAKKQQMGNTPINAVNTIAKKLPMLMLAQILGVSRHDADFLVEKGDQLIANSDPEFSDIVVDKINTDEYRLLPFRSPAALDLFDYAKKIYDNIKSKPQAYEGVLKDLLVNEHDYQMSIGEFGNFFCLLVAAGNDTTRYSIAATLHALANYPYLWHKFDDILEMPTDKKWNEIADEFIRYASPTMHFRRTATKDIILKGKTIKQNDKVNLWFVSANRDENQFAKADELHFDRQNKRHLGIWTWWNSCMFGTIFSQIRGENFIARSFTIIQIHSPNR